MWGPCRLTWPVEPQQWIQKEAALTERCTTVSSGLPPGYRNLQTAGEALKCTAAAPDAVKAVARLCKLLNHLRDPSRLIFWLISLVMPLHRL